MALNPELSSDSTGTTGDHSGTPQHSQKNDDSQVDFIRLPVCVWLRIMSFLPLPDRYHMTLSCDLFRQLFFDPSLWRSVDLACYLAGGPGDNPTLVLKPSHKQIAMQFGHLFHSVSLSMPHTNHLVREETAGVLTAIAERNSLKGLKLMSDSAMQIWKRTCSPPLSGHGLVIDMLKKLKSLLHLDLSEWPVVGPDRDLHQDSVLNVLLGTDVCPRLQSLNITDRTILGSESQEPYRQMVVQLVLKFVHLRHLRVRQILLSDLLLHELASTHRDRLQKLTLLICEPEEEEEMGGSTSTHISDTSWSRLKSSCPDLQLHVQAEVAHVPRVRWVLKPDLPVVSLELLFCSLPADLLSCIQQLHPSLRSLTCHVLPGYTYDLPLIQMVTACTKLQHLVFYGKVHGSTIRHLASLERQWRTFQFRLKQIVLKDLETVREVKGSLSAAGGSAGQKEAVCRGADGREKVDELCASVSDLLGFPWEPCQL